jgi:hypothetical protein
MMLGRYVVGVASLVIALVPIAFGARALRRRYVHDLIGPIAVLADVVISLSLVLVVSEMLGTVGLFALVPVVLTMAGVGLVGCRVGNRATRLGTATRDPAPVGSVQNAVPDRADTLGKLAASAAVAVVASEWCARVVNSLRSGMGTVDTLWYHMPIAARFAQSGWTSRLHFVDAHSLVGFYPNTSELLHGLGIVFLGNDTLSPLLNLGWLGLALFAAWCAGRPFGLAPLTLMGVAFVLATPQFVTDDAGQGLNDIVGLALILAAVAIIVGATRNPRRQLSFAALGCAGLAAGLALGSKYTLVAPVSVLSVGLVVIAARGERIARSVVWLGACSLTGGYWYVRNLLAVGNPIPPAHIGVGPLHLPTIPEPLAESPAKFLFDGHVWSTYYLPGIRLALGPTWWVVIGVIACGVAAGIRFGPDRVIRMLALFVAAAVALLLGLPQVLTAQPGGPPVFFGPNFRFAGTSMLVSALVLPIALARFGHRVRYVLYALYAGALVALQFDPEVWRHRYAFGGSPDGLTTTLGILVGVAILSAAVLVIALRSRAEPGPRSAVRRSRALSIACVVAVCVGGFGVERVYLDNRYAASTSIFRWARDVHDTRIAIVGLLRQYPLDGKDSSNFVQYLAVRHKDRTSTPIPDCATWRTVINEGRYKFLVIAPYGYPLRGSGTPVQQLWTRSDPSARLLIDEHGATRAWLYQIVGRLDPAGCT